MRPVSRWMTGYVATLALGVASGNVANAQLLQRLEARLNQAADAIGGASGEPLPAPAGAEPGYLGLVADDTNEDGRGLRVVAVNEDSPAAKAGIQEGDLVTEANGKPLKTLDDLAGALEGLQAGDRVAFKLDVAGRNKPAEVVLGRRARAPGAEPRPADPDISVPPPRTVDRDGPPADREPLGDELPADAIAGRPTLGISVAPVTDADRARYGITTRRGALISSIRPESPADRAGVPIGAVVVAIDGVRIDTADQLVDAIRTSRPGQEVELSYYNGPNLTRKTVRLASAGPPPAGIAGPSPRTNRIELGPPSDRPLLRAVERGLGNFGVAPGPGADGPVVEAGSGEVAALRREVAALRSQMQTLEERVQELEDRLSNQPAPTDRGVGNNAPPPEPRPADAASPPRLSPPRP